MKTRHTNLLLSVLRTLPGEWYYMCPLRDEMWEKHQLCYEATQRAVVRAEANGLVVVDKPHRHCKYWKVKENPLLVALRTAELQAKKQKSTVPVWMQAISFVITDGAD